MLVTLFPRSFDKLNIIFLICLPFFRPNLSYNLLLSNILLPINGSVYFKADAGYFDITLADPLNVTNFFWSDSLGGYCFLIEKTWAVSASPP